MSEETPKGLRRQPKAVTKPRVGNPWRDSVQGNVNAPVMRVRGGAPSGMPVPSWQSDGAPKAPRELPSDGAPELPSIVRAYALDAPELSYAEGATREASRAYTVSRPAASVAEDRADDAWQTTPRECASMREEHAFKAWERLYVKALESGHASFESLPLHPSIVAARTRALQSRSAPSTVIVRELPRAPMAHDPSLQTRTVLDAIAPRVVQRAPSPVAPAHAAVMGPALSALFEVLPRTVKGAARKGLTGGLPTTQGSAAVHPCQWCDSVACDHARRPDLRCGVYEWCGGDRGPKRPRVQPCPEWTAYVVARDAFKGPRKAHEAASQWIEEGRKATLDALRRLDARGVSIELDSPRGIPSPDKLQAGAWRLFGIECVGSPIPPMVADHRALDYTRLDACHYALARWDALRELLSSGTVEALSSVSDGAPRGVWWRDVLPSWMKARDAHNGAMGALAALCRSQRDTTVATVQPSRVQDTVKRVHRPSPLGEGARDATVELIARKAPTAPASAPRAPLPRVVAPAGVERIPARIAGDAPAYPVTPRLRTGDEASQCAPYSGRPIDARTAESIAAPPVAPPRELPLIRLTWCGAAPASGRWLQPLRFRRTPRAPLR